MNPFEQKRTFGKSNLQVSALGLGSSFGLPANEVERAFERGINFFFWGLIRRAGFGRGITNLSKRHREQMVIAVQSYTRVGFLMRPFFELALRRLQVEYVDILTLGWWNQRPPQRIIDAALALKESGKVKHLAISCHHRPAFEEVIKDPAFDIIMVRYNAAHPGAERDVFPFLTQPRHGVLAFTATRWGSLLKPSLTPAGEQTPRASDCYRFALSNSFVDASLAGVKDAAQLDEALAAIERGPMSDDELAWMKRVGAGVRDDQSANKPIRFLDKAWGAVTRTTPKEM
jgi:aryl-alcohol dehydrogenase-like predicted oxidoreductase